MSEEKNTQLAASERFMEKVLSEFTANIPGEIPVTDYQRGLIQGYFIKIDRALKAAEEERQRKNKQNSDPSFNNELPVDWNHVNLADLAIDLVHYARMGLDMLQANMLFPIPYKNNKRGWYDITLMPGYNGIRYMGERYALDLPRAVTVEVVYSTDVFRPIKKSRTNTVESYEFEITSPFDRGEIVGGFAYIEFDDERKNELIVMSLSDIEKRKPKYASPEFWGGVKKRKENGQWIEEQMDGWRDEMVRKTLIREAYSAKHLPRDPAKVDESFRHAMLMEERYAAIVAEAEVAANANAIPIEEAAEPAALPGAGIPTGAEEAVETVPMRRAADF